VVLGGVGAGIVRRLAADGASVAFTYSPLGSARTWAFQTKYYARGRVLNKVARRLSGRIKALNLGNRCDRHWSGARFGEGLGLHR
jgi:hypothetical protein